MSACARLSRSTLAILVTAGLVLFAAEATADGNPQLAQGEEGEVKPKGHFKVRRPAELTSARAEAIYQQIVDQMAEAYGLSDLTEARVFVRWTRHNTAPYQSATHGARYVSNYTNAVGKAYGKFEEAGVMPVGTLITKDSFTAVADGDIYPGPLFFMEKMDAGFNPKSGDWKYTMVMPDGSLFGITNGEGSENVEYCIGCHAAVEDQDHLYFIPDEFRCRALVVE